jgi:hypothetical protein
MDKAPNLPALLPSSEDKKIWRTQEDLLAEARSLTLSSNQQQKNMVARIMAKPELADEYMGLDYMQCESWWNEPETYFAFMLMLYLRGAQVEKTWSKEMVALGKELLKKEGR